MLDSFIRPYLDAPLARIATPVAAWGFTANHITAAAFIVGLLACFAVGMQAYIAGLALMLLSRLLDGIDGAVARINGPTPIGAYLDIVSDFIFYSMFVFFFALAEPNHALMATFVVFSFIGTGTTFLAHALLAEKKGLPADGKSFYQVRGLCEGTETILFFILICLWPDAFSAIAFLFGFLCWLTTGARIWEALRT